MKQNDLENQIKQLELERDRLTGQVEGLRGELDSAEGERRRQLMAEAMEARRRAGLMGDDDAERLTGMDDASLRLLIEDAGRLSRAQTPKAKYGAAGVDPLKAAMDEARVRLFGRRP